ncbi:hypothetical protein DVR12_05525 [Chitinophaga silvatica]|uniref:DUF6443 domain-containing protein n=1 Tax=Chitinophaga silvatica TaxID=2282649 RepID=A0A3E1YDX5_9BACT|nr:DUF6443 domain-containing protein [Chitinophaga silvatica]RFS24663.1 hypothetical protein DVR12_05525 [Chitinophaga silvatica]
MKIQQAIIFTIIFTAISTTLWAQNKPDGSFAPTAVARPVPSTYNYNAVNYRRTWSPALPTTDTAIVRSTQRTTAEVQQQTEYYDDFGRILQTVKKGINSGQDEVTPVLYDEFGREAFKYLPYTQQMGNLNDGKFKSDPFSAQNSFYSNTTLNPGINGEKIYYQEMVFEQSSLNRPTSNYSPGNSWGKTGGNRPVLMDYMTNTDKDSVRIWRINNSDQVVSTSSYAAGQLYKTITTDAGGNKSITYKDKSERIILVKKQFQSYTAEGHFGWLCTYYVFDDYNNLRTVLPPLAVEKIAGTWNTSSVLNTLCFQYRYDTKNQVISKITPGSDSVEMVYDIRGRLVFSRDGNQKQDGKWLATFYDDLNRPVQTAFYNSNASRTTLQNSMNAILPSSSLSYTIPAIQDLETAVNTQSSYVATNSVTLLPGFDAATEIDVFINPSAAGETIVSTVSNPLPSIDPAQLMPLTYTFYDSYNFSGVHASLLTDLSKPEAGSNLYAEPATSTSTATTGLTTGKKVRLLGTDQWLTSTNFYDKKNRVIQVVKDNESGGKSIISSLYDFNNKLLSTYERHNNLKSGITPVTTILTINEYDESGRLAKLRKRVNDNTNLERSVSVNEYDQLGRLKNKVLGQVSASQGITQLTYDYNIHGWIKAINKDYLDNGNATSHFGEELYFDAGYSTKYYNGDIAGIKWKGFNAPIQRSYGYTYDQASRLSQADYLQNNNTGTTTWSNTAIDFTVPWIRYDANGNITKMAQKGMNGTTSTYIDRFQYSYENNSNRLASVYDSSGFVPMLGDYKNSSNTADVNLYDKNGNLFKNPSRSISNIINNHLNLPSLITIDNKGTIQYVYDAEGNKIKKVVTDKTSNPVKTTTTNYSNGLVFENDSLKFFGHEEGRVRLKYTAGQTPEYIFDYFVKDHLGNTRIVLTEKKEISNYVATMETQAASTEVALFSNVDETRSEAPVGYPEKDANNKFVAKLNAKNGKKVVGPSIVLHVMAGDTIRIGTKAFYKSQGPEENKPASSVLESLAANILQNGTGNNSSVAAHDVQASGIDAIQNNEFNSKQYELLKEKNTDANNPNKPKAYLSYVLFDEQFKMVDENSGVKQVKETPDEVQVLAQDEIVASKSGFIYVYTSNESPLDVYFDNLAITLSTGTVVEETHYYPFGLTMAGISSNAMKGSNYPKNRNEYNGIEHTTDFDLNIYDAKLRNLDPQIGRWLQKDPKPTYYSSPYASMANNPIKYSDFLGDTIVNNDGSKVSYSIKNSGLEWSNNVSSDIMRIGNAMAQTEIGLKTLDDMSKAKHPIKMIINTTDDMYFDGKGRTTDKGMAKLLLFGWTDNIRDKDKLIGSEITIYEKNIKKIDNAKSQGKNVEKDFNGTKVNLTDYSLEDHIGANGVHEGVHATDKKSMTVFTSGGTEDNPRKLELIYYNQRKNP